MDTNAILPVQMRLQFKIIQVKHVQFATQHVLLVWEQLQIAQVVDLDFIYLILVV